MGARTLVAVERRDGRYDLHHSQWGGEHLDRLSGADGFDDVTPGLVAPDPVETAVPTRGVLSGVDPRAHEAVVVFGERTEAYLVCWLGIETGQRSGDATTAPSEACPSASVRSATALVPWTEAAAAARLRRFSRTAKEVLGDAVDAGVVPSWAATAYLAVRFARHPDSPEETLWLPERGASVQ